MKIGDPVVSQLGHQLQFPIDVAADGLLAVVGAFVGALVDIEGRRQPDAVGRAVTGYRNSLQDRPVTANNAVRYLKMLFNFAVDQELFSSNPVSTVKPIKIDSEGWKPWPELSLERFAKQSTGSPRTAFYLALYTGQRRADVLAMRWDAIKDGGITVKQAKTGKDLWIPLHPALAAELDRARKTMQEKAEARAKKKRPASVALTIVHRANGQPYTGNGFNTIWQREQNRLMCSGLPFHGLRKNATTALIEAGCSIQQVQAITGHATLEMVAHYGRSADQKRLAKQAMRKLTDGCDQD